MEPRVVARSLACRRAARTTRRLRLQVVVISTSLMVCLVPVRALAQQSTDGHEIRSPDIIAQSSGQVTLDAEASAAVRGTVTDASGASVTGSEVSLSPADGTSPRTTTTGTNGEFSFTKILPGSYLLRVKAENFAPSIVVVDSTSDLRAPRRPRSSNYSARETQGSVHRHFQAG